MAAGLTDHVWSLYELLMFRVSPTQATSLPTSTRMPSVVEFIALSPGARNCLLSVYHIYSTCMNFPLKQP